MRLICCLDTNAILDMCYRYYPSSTFGPLWSKLESAVIASQISFIQSEHISIEMNRKLVQFGYPKANYGELLKLLEIEVIKTHDYSEALDNLKGCLMTEIPFIRQKKSPTSFIEGLTEDLSNIAVADTRKAKVITSEQGFGHDIANPAIPKKTQLKIPDVCIYRNVPCSNWLEVFSYLGIIF